MLGKTKMPSAKTDDFSHPAIKSLYRKRIIELLDRYNYSFNQLQIAMSIVNESIPKALAKKIQDTIDKVFQQYGVMVARMDISPRGKRNYRDVFRIEANRCESCNKKTTRIQDAHIITRIAIKRKPKAWKVLNRHMSNFFLLCPTCHEELDRGALGTRMLNKLIGRHKKILLRMEDMLVSDCEILDKLDNILSMFEDELIDVGTDVFVQSVKKSGFNIT